MQTTFLSALFLTALGFLLTYYGSNVDIATKLGITIDSSALQFSGAIIAALFWVCQAIMMDCSLHKVINYSVYLFSMFTHTGPLDCTDMRITFLRT